MEDAAEHLVHDVFPTAVQRFGSAIDLNVHFHTLIPDGVFDLERPGRALFVRLPAPSELELERT